MSARDADNLAESPEILEENPRNVILIRELERRRQIVAALGISAIRHFRGRDLFEAR